MATDFLESHLRPLLSEPNEDDAVEEEQAQLRQESLLRVFREDHDGRQSMHARFLQGATPRFLSEMNWYEGKGGNETSELRATLVYLMEFKELSEKKREDLYAIVYE
ncbi:MAG: hypothetical protein HYW07_06330 [Candidatus Latescibacteria bacterium]|nr:hypothetical protein [Candidatus Latescibacterota bacterium]